MRLPLIALATIALLSGEIGMHAGVSGVAEASAGESSADGGSAGEVRGVEINVGDQLQATRDVSLDEAVIAAGSKISVSGKRQTGGRVLLDVALADGHVVKGVPLVEIRKSFRPVK